MPGSRIHPDQDLLVPLPVRATAAGTIRDAV
jgi:hypothetical protein